MTPPPERHTGLTLRFEHEMLPQRVVFAAGEARTKVGREVDLLGAERVMVIAGEHRPELSEEVTGGLPVALRHHDVVMHVPVEVAERARKAAIDHEVDALVPVGGGSTTGLAKAVALALGLPIVAVPTTYAGSEATNVWGMTDSGTKTTGTDDRVLPRAVVYDAALTTSLPVELSVASGLNALAHGVDAMWAPRSNPINQALAIEGIRALRAGLPRVADDPSSLPGREQTLYGAYLAALSFASAGSALHHKICHVLGGRHDLPHAQTHAIVLPHVLALNQANAPEAAERIAAAFGAPTALEGLERLRSELGAPRALEDLGFEAHDIPGAARAILPQVPASNPTSVTLEVLEALLRAAWEGADPE